MSSEGQIEGKHWIYPSGITEFCDDRNLVDRGDVELAREDIEQQLCRLLDMDHELYPERRICQTFGMAYENSPQGGIYEEGHFEKWVLKEGWGLDPQEANFQQELAARCPQAVSLYESYRREPCEYVMREQGWVFVVDDKIDTRKFDVEDRQRIATAVEEILRSNERGPGIGDHSEAGNFRFRIIGLPGCPEFSATLSQIASGESLEQSTAAQNYVLADEQEPESSLVP